MTNIDLDALEATALAATIQKPWMHYETMQADNYVTAGGGILSGDLVCGATYEKRNAQHIAAFDPPTVLRLIARLREAEAVIEAIDAIEPMWPRGMYGCPQDMIGRNQIRAVTARYKTTKTEGNEP